MTPDGWRLAALGELLQSVRRPEQVQASRTYNLLGVKWHGKGCHTHMTVPGSELKTGVLNRVEVGDVTYNRMWVTKGALAVVQSEHEGMHATGEYPTFLCDRQQVLTSFMGRALLSRSFIKAASDTCRGSTSRTRLNPGDFLRLPILLPPIEEQKKIDEILASIDETAELSQAVLAQLQILKDAMMGGLLRGIPGRHNVYKPSPFGDVPMGWAMRKFGTLTEQSRRHVDVDVAQEYREIGVRSHGRGIFLKHSVTGADIGSKKVFWVEGDCLIFNIVFAWEGAVSSTSPREEGTIASHRFPMYRPDPSHVDLGYLRLLFQTPAATSILASFSPGSAGRNRTLNQGRLRELEIPLPPLQEQRDLAGAISTVECRIAEETEFLDALKSLQAITMAKLLNGDVRVGGNQEPA